ncbi:MAG: hypothetical protein AVDCRST_MAG89-1710, partial [uncultured Gemmatimonadetes bacterium]
APARVPQPDAAQHQVGAAPPGRGVAAQARHQLVPRFLLDQRHLPAAPLVGVAHQSAPGHHHARIHRVHRPALGPLDPDRRQFTHGRSLPRDPV